VRAYIVVDLGFGDAGKGLLTDFLARHFHASLVVRYNGGAQAGHHVVAPDGRQHTFSQFGSGTFIPGVQTFLSKHVVIHPGALLVEGKTLEQKGVRDVFSRLRISEQALVITPFHQAANRIREIARGKDRHGSCGVGMGEAFEDAQSHLEDCILAGDLNDPKMLRRKAASIRERTRTRMGELCKERSLGQAVVAEWEVFEREGLIDDWIASISPIDELGLVAAERVLQAWLGQAETAIFEGAQGVLLDAQAGFHPYTTWSNCTAAQALELISELAPGSPAYRIGVMRAYAVRHGAGPLPTETEALTPMISEHNQANPWQGPVRYGWFDAVLARYALGVAGGVDALAVTHLDFISRLKAWTYCPGYTGALDLPEATIDSTSSQGVLTSFHMPPSLPLERRQALTKALFEVTPVLDTCDRDEAVVIRTIQALTGRPVDLVSRGPAAADIQLLNPLPV